MSKYAMCDGSLVDIENYMFNYDIEVIAHHLAKIQRFNGAAPIDITYSVAEHSLNLANIFLENSIVQEAMVQAGVDNKVCALYALIHDASEAYVGDLVSPLKKYCREYQIIEDNIQKKLKRCLFYRFLGPKDYLFVKNVQNYVHLYDKRILLDEVASIMPEKFWVYQNELLDSPIGCRIMYNNRPSYIKNQFLRLYKELIND